MKYKLYTTVILFFLISITLKGQFEKLAEISVDSDFFSSDTHGNVYYSTKDSLVKLEFKTWKPSSYRFSSRYKYTSIDVSNPDYLSLYSEDSRQLVILDSSLRVWINPFFMDQLGLYEVSKVFTDKNEHLWMYNYLSKNIVRLNKSFQISFVSEKLEKIYPSTVEPNFFKTNDGLVFINYPAKGILILTDDSKFITFLRIEGIYDFHIINNEIFYYRDQILSVVNYKTFQGRELHVPPEPGIKNALFIDPYIILQTKDKILVYLTQ